MLVWCERIVGVSHGYHCRSSLGGLLRWHFLLQVPRARLSTAIMLQSVGAARSVH
jgi:hypothetical protein